MDATSPTTLATDEQALLDAVRAAVRSGARILQLPSAWETPGVVRNLASAVAPGRPCIDLRVPDLPSAWLGEEVASALLDALSEPVSPREDLPGLTDAVAEALRVRRMACVVIRDAGAWLGVDGAPALARWTDHAETTFVLFTTEVAGDATVHAVPCPPPPEPALRLPTAPSARSLFEALRGAAAPVPAMFLSLAFAPEPIGEPLAELMASGLVRPQWRGTDMLLDVPRPVRTWASAQASDPSSNRQRLDFAIACGASADVDEAGDARSLAREAFLVSQRSLLRDLWRRTAADQPELAAKVALPLLAAMRARGPLSSLLETVAAIEAIDLPRSVRCAVRVRRAAVLRELGRGREGGALLVSEPDGYEGVSGVVLGQLALALEALATPEREGEAMRARAAVLRGRLNTNDVAQRALRARGLASSAWTHGDARDAFAHAIDALAAYRAAGHEVGELQMLSVSASCALGANDPNLLDLTVQLEIAGRRTGRADLESLGRGLRGCAHLDRGEPGAALEHLGFAIDRLSEFGLHYLERWRRVHRAVAHLALGDRSRATRDCEDFVAMTQMMSGSPIIGLLVGTLAGNARLRADLEASRDVPPCFAEIGARVLERAGSSVEKRPDGASPRAPGFYAFEVRMLERLLDTPVRAPSDLPGGRRLQVASDGSWFEVDVEGRVDLARTRTLRKLLVGFAEARARGVALSLDEVFSLGWPGERAAASSVANRVHVTICRLRSMGLRDMLVYRGGGWAIEEHVQLELRDAR